MNPCRLASLLSPRSLDPRRDVGSGGRPEWTEREVALGLAGLEQPYEAAFRYRWAREFGQFSFLEKRLAEHAAVLAKREHWPERVRNLDGERIPFPRDELVRLALLEEHYQGRMKSPEFMTAVLNVTENLWRRRLRPPYEALRQEIEVWNASAYSHIARRLR